MSDQPDPQPPDPTTPEDPIAHLTADVAELRRQIADGITTRRIAVIDNRNNLRATITTDDDGNGRICLYDPDDGNERATLSAKPGTGSLSIVGRSKASDPTHVEIFALDPGEDDGPYVGVELIDQGNSVAGFTLYEGHEPRTWTSTDEDLSERRRR